MAGNMRLEESEIEVFEEDVVVIVGGGPIGLMVAFVLAYYGVKSVLLERNLTTTRWPKMDLTNSRSMEILRRIGLADEVRELGVPSTVPYNVFMTSGLRNEHPFASWEFPSVNELREEFRQDKDGISPQEPWQRISQELFERLLKEKCDASGLIDCRFGWKVHNVTESGGNVTVTATHLATEKSRRLRSTYVVACDGASSRVRRDLGIPLEGGPIPGYTLLVHFKSRDLSKLFKFGTFWHLFIFGKTGLQGAVICQDNKEIFTTHLMLPLGSESDDIGSHEAVYNVLGGTGVPFEIEIDEILVRSTYRHSVAVARTYRSALGNVFLAGDSAHQNVPTGGYGMNMGIGDAFDIGWKLAAVIQKHADVGILASYEQERRPVALSSVQRSRIHHDAHFAANKILADAPDLVEVDSLEGQRLREKLQQHYADHNNENQDLGVEMDHRHVSCVYPRSTSSQDVPPPWSPKRYTPSTCSGCRAPHINLSNGQSIFDQYGKHWSLLHFVDTSTSPRPENLLRTARELDLPLVYRQLVGEQTAHDLWERSLVLVRPDGHVAWRGHEDPNEGDAIGILHTISGRDKNVDSSRPANVPDAVNLLASRKDLRTQTSEYSLERMGIMQE